MAESIGQIPNNGFEDWHDAGNYLAPDGWWTANDAATGTYYPVTRSTDHFPVSLGDFSIRLENNIAVLPDWGAMGIAWTGDVNGSNYPVFPVVGHPTSVCGYYKFFPQNGDTMEIHIRLYHNGVDVSGGQFKTAATIAEWASFCFPISEYTEADSARIMMMSCYDNDEPVAHGNSILYMDNLSFDGLITAVISDTEKEDQIFIYPNPASGQLTISFTDYRHEHIDLEILNALGQRTLMQKMTIYAAKATVDISHMQVGVYFLRMSSDNRIFYDENILIVR